LHTTSGVCEAMIGCGFGVIGHAGCEWSVHSVGPAQLRASCPRVMRRGRSDSLARISRKPSIAVPVHARVSAVGRIVSKTRSGYPPPRPNLISGTRLQWELALSAMRAEGHPRSNWKITGSTSTGWRGVP
jgi:hypothetical protein